MKKRPTCFCRVTGKLAPCPSSLAPNSGYGVQFSPSEMQSDVLSIAFEIAEPKVPAAIWEVISEGIMKSTTMLFGTEAARFAKRCLHSR